jgi:hypothetical protein
MSYDQSYVFELFEYPGDLAGSSDLEFVNYSVKVPKIEPDPTEILYENENENDFDMSMDWNMKSHLEMQH